MKKIILSLLLVATIISSCESRQAQGMYMGASMGSILGNAVGGLLGGARGSDLGTLVGAVGGAVIMNEATKGTKNYDEDGVYSSRRRNRERQNREYSYYNNNNEIYSSNDIIMPLNDISNNYNNDNITTNVINQQTQSTNDGYAIDLRSCDIEGNGDGILTRNEVIKVVFELFNTTNNTLYNIEPTVIQTTKNKHIYISPTKRVDSLMPGKGIKYTALVTADRWLKNGSITLNVYVKENGEIASQTKTFNIETSKK